ncbi:hypothetical protein MKK42_18325 [Escherichia coli]|uniref:hypothetical protein n=1 Tax=Escherichia coli TaxID=562 RepID=UPI001F56C7B6|nr:hypothetical protein [Escherichia coli]MCI2234053.1 hypothetical protein [Escherichia coli]
MTSRERFEKYAGGRLGLPIEMIFDARNGDRYLHAFDSMSVMQPLNGWWGIWQASRAAIEIKLPNQACLATWHYAGSPPDDFYEDIEISRKPSEDKSVDGTEPFPLLTKWEVEQAIELAGLKVKK